MSILKSDVNTKLVNLLDTQCREIDLLSVILDEEKTALIEQLTTLHQISEKKQIQVEKLEQLTVELLQLLVDTGFSGNEEGLMACVQWCTASPSEIIEQWEYLKEKIAVCKKANLFNGALLEMSQFRVKAILSIITQGRSSFSTYNAGGQSKQDISSNSFSVKA